ncbi:MAG: tRNA pseudouridine(38-40) synthase TruA [Acidimicrobiia bacterium]
MTSSGEAPPVQRLQLVVAYDGTDFRGFAAQPDVRTVEGTLSAALAKVLRTSPQELGLVCAGRTDAGVHARGQVVSVDAPAGSDLTRVRTAVNRMIGPEVVVRGMRAAPPEFDARRSATARTYRYTIVNRPEPDPFLARYSWWVPVPLEIARLRLASDPFIGEHDFAAFCRRGPEGSTTMRTVLSSRWLPDDRPGVLVYEIVATAFCWQMVRSVVGTLVEAGAGRRRPGDILRTLRSGDRAQAGAVAPPHGLCLWRVDYDG